MSVTASPTGTYIGAACGKHMFEPAAARCRRCALPFCEDCLVYPFGECRPGFCLGCAVIEGGIRRDRRHTRAARCPRQRNETGASAVEYALLLALLIVLTFVTLALV